MADQSYIKEYYRNNIPVLPGHSNFRQFRVRLFDGSFRKIKDIIRSPEDLQKHLIALCPKDVYFMTSRFLNPVYVGPKVYKYKAGYKWANNVFLGAELYFDIDDDDKAMALKIIGCLKEMGYKQFKLLKTSRGYHIHVLSFESDNEEIIALKSKPVWDPKAREKRYYEIRAGIVLALKKKGCIFDEPITLDTRRIIKVENTLAGDDMFRIHEVSFMEVDRSG